MYVGIRWVQDGILYIRYRSSSMIIRAERCKALTDKKSLLFYRKSYSQSATNLSQSQENQACKNYNFVPLLSSSHKTKTIECIQTFFISSNSTLLLEMFLFWFRAAWKVQTAHYSSKHASWTLSDSLFCAHFNQRRRHTIIEHVIGYYRECMESIHWLVVKRGPYTSLNERKLKHLSLYFSFNWSPVTNLSHCIPSLLNMAELDVEHCIGNKGLFCWQVGIWKVGVPQGHIELSCLEVLGWWSGYSLFIFQLLSFTTPLPPGKKQ